MGFVVELQVECVVALLNFLFVNVKCQEIDLDGRRDSFVRNVSRLKLPDPGMAKNLFNPTQLTKPAFRVLNQQAFQQHLNLSGELNMGWKFNLLILYRVINLINIP